MATTPHAALRGLDTAVGSDGELPQMLRDDPTLYKAYELSLLDSLQGQGRTARRQGMSAMDLEGEKTQAALRDEPFLRGMDREQASLDAWQQAADKSGTYWRFGEPIEALGQKNAIEKARATGEANSIDDLIRLQGTKYTADQNLAGKTGQNALAAATAALRALTGEAGNARQYGDQGRLDAVVPRLDAMTGSLTAPPQAGMPQTPGAAAPGGASAPKGPLSEAQLLRGMQTSGETRAQALQHARTLGYDITGLRP